MIEVLKAKDNMVDESGEDKFGKRRSIRLPAWHEKYLKLWAYIKGVGGTTLSQNILQARIEANKSQIDVMIEDLAKDRNITTEELKTQIVEQSND